MKLSKSQNHLLEHAVWEEDMVEEELIVFNGSTAEFVALIGPLLLSRKWTVNGKHEVIPFLRSFDEVFRIYNKENQTFLAFGTLKNAVQEYIASNSSEL